MRGLVGKRLIIYIIIFTIVTSLLLSLFIIKRNILEIKFVSIRVIPAQLLLSDVNWYINNSVLSDMQKNSIKNNIGKYCMLQYEFSISNKSFKEYAKGITFNLYEGSKMKDIFVAYTSEEEIAAYDLDAKMSGIKTKYVLVERTNYTDSQLLTKARDAKFVIGYSKWGILHDVNTKVSLCINKN